MSLHTLIIGTSKSKNLDGYYFEAKERFWRLIHISGLTPRQYKPEEYRLLLAEGIGFAELAFHHQLLGESNGETVFSQDQQLNEDLDVISRGIPELQKFILNSGATRIVFNGKTAISAFFEFDEKGVVESLNSQFAKKKQWEYGLCTKWKGIDVFMLPNLSATASAEWKKHNGEAHWLNFWGSLTPKQNYSISAVKKEKSGLTPTQKMWAGLILFMFCIIAGLVFILITKDIVKH